MSVVHNYLWKLSNIRYLIPIVLSDLLNWDKLWHTDKLQVEITFHWNPLLMVSFFFATAIIRTVGVSGWQTTTDKCVMQGDGNLVVKNTATWVLWNSGSYCHSSLELRAQANANVFVRDDQKYYWGRWIVRKDLNHWWRQSFGRRYYLMELFLQLYSDGTFTSPQRYLSWQFEDSYSGFSLCSQPWVFVQFKSVPLSLLICDLAGTWRS